MIKPGSLLFCICILRFSFSLKAQNSDTIKGPVKKDHSPRKAAIRSAILPGWGQAYNKRYWKIPILYAGIGVNTYFFITNQQSYKAEVDRLESYPNNNNPNDPVTIRIKNNRDTYRSWRDWNIAIFAGIYI